MKNGFVLSLLIILVSCGETKQEEEAMEASLIKGTATPVWLDAEEGEILLSDYFLDTSLIDSLGTPHGFEAELRENNTKAYFKMSDETPYIVNLRVWSDGIANDIPLFKSNKENRTITLNDPNKQYEFVGIKGQFSNWETSDMNYENGNWSSDVRVVPGDHQYVLIADGTEMPNPDEPITTGNGMGGTNSVLRVPVNAEKQPFLQTESITDDGFTLVSSQPATSVLAYLDNQLISSENIKSEGNTISIALPDSDSERSYVRVYAANEFGRSNDVLLPLENGAIVTDASQLKRTDFHTQIMYFLMVDRFLDGNPKNTKKVDNDSISPKANYYGGDLEGVLAKINDGYFTDMGINTIWLSPITQNPEGAYGLWPEPLTKFSGYHGYWPVSNTKIDYRFGNEQVFRDLIAAAHEKDINVILDYVANHVHELHPLYKEHSDWATNLYLEDGSLNTERWDDHRLTTWFDTFMPTLDFSKPEVVEKMTDSAAYWVTNYDLDGFRHDATKHIQLKFWRTLTEKVKKRVERPVFQIGETYGSPDLIRSYISTGMLDSQFDFNLYDASVQTFGTDISFERLAKQLQQGLDYYGYHHLMGNISGNQDRARFISYASGDVRFDEDAKKAGWTRTIGMSDTTAYNKLGMLQAFNLTTPGIPCIYYGDEYGSIGGNDPDNRKMMKFEDLDVNELQLKRRVQELVKLRRNSMALQYGSTKILAADDTKFVIQRQYFDEVVTVVFNKGTEAIQYDGEEIPANDFKIIQKTIQS
ncbi:alpha-amylase family glycosyl hydrolase [Luteirhabdus pelagi]|uniref:alpha-amylase family glycosyl hydrolase n=1 Tax=Luteirhabdus pelagi TaxID=2792783 RepID=UPI00193A2583|nr:alpha-amylase family glycosyl hydrolase [Luteirhabdus pelagi]